MFKGGIYMIIVKDVGVYYGETVNIKTRWARHRKQLYSGRHHCIKLRRAFKYLGPEAFKFTILEQSERLDKSKQYRMLRQSEYIRLDPLCLNTAVNEKAYKVTEKSLPNRPVYRNKEVKLQRVAKSGLVLVKDNKTGKSLGVEVWDKQFNLGVFTTDVFCTLIRKGK